MKKRVVSIILALCIVLTALPLSGILTLAATSGDFQYEVLSETDKTCKITGYIGSETELVIPSTLGDYAVTGIGWGAFINHDSFTNVSIPNSVTFIGGAAFSGCDSLVSILIPDSVVSIGDSAFSSCDLLESITIPHSVTNIGNLAFSGCSSLTNIKVDRNNLNYTSEAGVLFSKDKTVLIQYPKGKTDATYSIPDSVVSIGNGAFKHCDFLTSVTIPDGVVSIGDGAFAYCDLLADVTIGNDVTSIGDTAFEKCISLTNVIIPDGVTSIGGHAFYSCTALAGITLGSGVKTIGQWAFADCDSLISITIGSNVECIEYSAFYSCDSLVDIIISDSVMSIGSSAFGGTAYFSNANNWENDILYVGNHCVSAKRTLGEDCFIRDGTITIADRTFSSCGSLTSVTIPDSVASIGDSAFQGCSSLTNVTIGDGITSIGDSVFSGCDNLTIHGKTGGYAETYALENDIPFVALNNLGDSAHVYAESVTARPGETIQIPLYVENNPGVAYVKFKVAYDSDKLDLISAEDQGIFKGIYTTSQTIDVNPYVLQWMNAGNATGNGCFVMLTFKVLDDAAEGDVSIRVTYDEAYNETLDDVAFTFTNPTVTIRDYTPGDINDDGVVNGKDGIILSQYLAEWGTEINLDAADVNGDGVVNGKDSIILSQYLAAWDVELGK